MRWLSGKRVLITRARAQSGELARALEAEGATVVPFAAIRIERPADRRALRSAAARLKEYDWVVFTSVNGVERFLATLASSGAGSRIPDSVRVAAVGAATAASLRQRGVEPTVVPDRHTGDALADVLCGRPDLSAAKVLLPRGDRARQDLPARLAERGAQVEEVVAYRTLPNEAGVADARAKLEAGMIDAITFLSPSAVESFVASLGTGVGRAVVAVIGPVTGEAALACGLAVHIQAREHSVQGLTEALVAYFR